MAAFLQFEGTKQDDAAEQIKRLYALFLKVDATQIEINPFGETPDGQGILCHLLLIKADSFVLCRPFYSEEKVIMLLE